MSDWNVGDLAVCVDAADRWYTINYPGHPRLVEGATYHVVGFGRDDSGNAVPNLLLAEIPSPLGYGMEARRFRKIRPDAHETSRECEQLLTLLKRRKVSA